MQVSFCIFIFLFLSVYLHVYNLITKVFCFQVEYEKKKKEEGKRARVDKQKVLEMLFSAFEKHKYYNIKDLVEITKQPVVSHNVSESARLMWLNKYVER